MVLESDRHPHPAARGDPRRAAQGHAGDSVRSLSPASSSSSASSKASSKKASRSSSCSTARCIWRPRRLHCRPKIEQLTELACRRDRVSSTRQIKEVSQKRSVEHHHRRAQPTGRGAAGFKTVQPVVFCGLFRSNAGIFEKLRDSLYKAAG